MLVKTRKCLLTRFSFSVSVSLSLSLCSALERKSEKQTRRRLLFTARLLKRLYRAWQRGSACPSLIALFILCAVQGVSNALGLCVRRETTHCILSSVPRWGMGSCRSGYNRSDGGERGGDKKQTYREAMVLQSCCAQRLMKRNFTLSCSRCNCGVPADRDSGATLGPGPDTTARDPLRLDGVGWAQ